MDVPASVRVERNLEDLRQELNNKLMFLRNKSSDEMCTKHLKNRL